METLITNTTTFINELVKDVMLPIIIDYISQHENPHAITQQELEEVLNLNNPKYGSHSKRSTVSVETDYNKKCIWEYKRGKSKGDLCGKPVVRNENYCSTCIKRSFFNPKRVNNDVTKSAIIFDDIPKSAENDNQSVELEVYDANNNLLINYDTNFIFKRYDDDTFKITGRADNINKDYVHKLTQEDIIMAKQLNYSIDEEGSEQN